MQLIENLAQIKTPYDQAVITIGNFDGVHIGHQALFHQVIEKAESIGGTAVAMTFEPHPLRVIRQNAQPPLITLYEQKIELIRNTGVDVLICLPFTHEFADLTATEFVKDILVKRIGMKAIVVGNDYAFGKNREGNLDFLQSHAAQWGFEVLVLDWVQTPTLPDRISSTRVRELVMEGDVETARRMLGRFYQIRGTVTKGRNRGGRLLGFPTANINLYDELCPQTGVYAVTVDCLDRKFNGVANIGYSPTFDDHIFTVEVHILDFQEDIYDKKIKVDFIKRLRNEMKFASLDELSVQIRKDIETARKILGLAQK